MRTNIAGKKFIIHPIVRRLYPRPREWSRDTELVETPDGMQDPSRTALQQERGETEQANETSTGGSSLVSSTREGFGAGGGSGRTGRSTGWSYRGGVAEDWGAHWRGWNWESSRSNEHGAGCGRSKRNDRSERADDRCVDHYWGAWRSWNAGRHWGIGHHWSTGSCNTNDWGAGVHDCLGGSGRGG